MNPFQNAINNLFNFKSDIGLDERFYEDIECPKCKTRLSDLKETSFVGCAYCYKVFKDTVTNLAYRYHGRVEHLGKIPTKQIDRASKLKEIEELEALKKKYVQTEDYEQANICKRKIEKLRSEI